jgi:hypothetical protein
MTLSTLYPAILVFAGQFLNVFVRAFQQRNVAHLHYKWVMPTSAVFALGDMVVILSVVAVGPSLTTWLALAMGGGLGCLLSMKTHERLVGKSEAATTQPKPSSLRSTIMPTGSGGAKETSSSTSPDTQTKEVPRTYEKLCTIVPCSLSGNTEKRNDR